MFWQSSWVRGDNPERLKTKQRADIPQFEVNHLLAVVSGEGGTDENQQNLVPFSKKTPLVQTTAVFRSLFSFHPSSYKELNIFHYI